MGEVKLYLKRVAYDGNTFVDKNEQLNAILPGETTIGRALQNKIQCSNLFVSRYQCVISVDPSENVYIRDVGSINGTFLNWVKIKPQENTALAIGDIIGLGLNEALETNGCNAFFFMLCKVKNQAKEKQNTGQDENCSSTEGEKDASSQNEINNSTTNLCASNSINSNHDLRPKEVVEKKRVRFESDENLVETCIIPRRLNLKKKKLPLKRRIRKQKRTSPNITIEQPESGSDQNVSSMNDEEVITNPSNAVNNNSAASCSSAFEPEIIVID